MNYLSAALEYHAAGLKIIPFYTRPDGSKSFPPEYAQYRDGQTEDQVRVLFTPDSSGVCLLCTDGIEAIDIDVKHDPRASIRREIIAAMDEFGFNAPGVVQTTKSAGAHLIYRCPAPEGNQKLARRRGEKEAMIETRGKGGLLFIAPTPGYSVISGSLFEIPTISQEDRDYLVKICRHFDEVEPIEFAATLKPEAQKLPGKKPWEAFDDVTDVLDMMQRYGWKVVSKTAEHIRLNRPGAKHSRGIDGSIILKANIFYPFTSSTEFEPNHGYSPAAVYAIMEHRGNFSEAAKSLYRQGFGDRIDKAVEAKAKLPALIEKVECTRFDVNTRIIEKKALLTYLGEKAYPVAGRGMIGVFTGQEKSGKSFVASCIAASGIAAGQERLNFCLDLDGGKMLWFDTEQSGYFYHKTQGRAHRIAGVEHNVPHYIAYHLRPLSPVERIEVIEYYIYNTPGVSVVMIDGFVDLAKDYNDLTEVQELVGRLMKWSDEKQVLILGVLHVNKGDGKIRGHFGSELKNKCDVIIHAQQSETNIYQVTNPTSRYAAFPSMTFSRDDEGLPVYQANESEFKPNFSTQFPAAAFNPASVPMTRSEYAPF